MHQQTRFANRSLAPRHALIGFVAVAWLLSASTASAFLDLYAGKAYTKDSTIEIAIAGFPTSVATADWDDTAVFGIRGGGYLPGVLRFIGLGVDFSYFQPSPTSAVDLHVMPISPMLFIRIPLLTSDDIPGGRIQPYAAAGPAFVVTYAESDLAGAKAVGFDIGYDIRAGMRIMLAGPLGIFGEWRYTDVKARADIKGVDGHIESHLQTNHITGGLSFEF